MTRVRQRFVDALRATTLDLLASKLLVAFMQEGSGTEKMAVKRTSKCGSLGERVAKLQDDGSIVLARDGVAGPRLPQDEERREGDRLASFGGEAPTGVDWRTEVRFAISHANRPAASPVEYPAARAAPDLRRVGAAEVRRPCVPAFSQHVLAKLHVYPARSLSVLDGGVQLIVRVSLRSLLMHVGPVFFPNPVRP